MVNDNNFKVIKPYREGNTKLIEDFKVRKAGSYIGENILCVKELQQIMQLPTKINQKEFKIESVDSREIQVDKVFTREGMKICKTKYKGKETIINFPLDDLDSLCQCFLTIGQMGTGKTTGAQNNAIYLLEHGVSVFAIDVADGGMIDNISNGLDPKFNKRVILDFGDTDNPIGIAWNEGNGESSRDYINTMAVHLKNFLNKLADSNMEQLSSRMEKYLGAAAKAVYSGKGGGIYDIILCLTDAKYRHKLIEENKITGRVKMILEQLDDSKDESGTRKSYVAGVLDRLDALLDNEAVANCLLQPPNKNINFRKWADEGYFVGIKIPKSRLSDDGVDLMVTYIVSKLWLAILSRENTPKEERNPCILFLDEPHQFPTVFKELYTIIREMRKWRLGLFIMAHEFGDFKSMKNVLKAAGTNYIMYKTSKETCRELLEEFEPFELEEMLNIKWRHALISLRYKDKVLKVMGDMTGATPVKQKVTYVNKFGTPREVVEQDILDKMV